MRPLAVLIAVVALTLFAALPGFGQTSDELKALQKEIEALKEGQTAIQRDLQEIKNLLRARPAPPPPEPQNVVLSVEGAPVKGAETARVVVFEFSDYQ